MSDLKAIVARGYDQIAARYAAWSVTERRVERERYTQILIDRLEPGAELLELGCGSAAITTKRLAERFHLTGVDLSAEQIALAKQHVPHARFIHADMTRLNFSDASFDAVAAFYSLFHIPRSEQAALLSQINTWLKPGGLLLATLGCYDMEAEFTPDWLGAEMYWSSYDAATNKNLVSEAGFTLLSAEIETDIEEGDSVSFLWILAQKHEENPV
jgi:ubiquinone/menaquinone biosynthesis C-methylase UbiE